MTSFAWETLTVPLAETDPCGPDLDMEGDPTFMTFLARAEGTLPASYFQIDDEGRSVPFDRTQIAYADEQKAIYGFLADTRDLRLLIILAKLAVLSRDLPTFVESVDGLSRLVKTWWNEVHPRGEDDGFALRLVMLQTLDDNPTVVAPLLHLPVLKGRRAGNISLRNLQVALGEAQLRNGEEQIDLATIEAALGETELSELVALRDAFTRARSALETLQALWIERVGYDQALTFPRLSPVVTRLEKWMDEAVGRRDPSARTTAPESGDTDKQDAAAQRPTAGGEGLIDSSEGARRALTAVSAYFASSEPSSPALLLVRQAEQLVGKNFHEIIAALMPERADQARIAITGDIAINLPIERLSTLPITFAEEPERTSSDDGWGWSDPQSEETDASSEPDEDTAAASSEWGEDAPAANGHDEAQDSASANGGRQAFTAGQAPSSAILVTSRNDAVAVLATVSRFYRTREPASPIPLLVDRAAALATKDFAALLKDVIPAQE